MRLAITPGTAYGMKIAVRAKPRARTLGVSSSSANSRARPRTLGMEMSPKTSTRPNPARNSASVSAAR
jgi:hypothetical protein